MAVEIPYLPVSFHHPYHHYDEYVESTTTTLSQLKDFYETLDISKLPSIENPYIVHEVNAIQLFLLGFLPVFALFKFSTNSRSPLHIIASTGIAAYWFFLPLVIKLRPGQLLFGWIYHVLLWLFAHKTILWLFTDFHLFRNEIIVQHKMNIFRQWFEFVRVASQFRVGVPSEWRKKYAAKKTDPPASTDSTTSADNNNTVKKEKKPKVYAIPSGGPSVPYTLIRFLFATFWSHILPQLSDDAMDTTFFTMRSFKTNFVLINAIWLYGSTVWDVYYLTIRYAISAFVKIHRFVKPHSELFIVPASENTVPFFVQEHLTLLTEYESLFGFMYNFRNLRHFWAKIWHQVFKSIFADLIYFKLTYRGCSQLRSTFALTCAFFISGTMHEYVFYHNHGPDTMTFENTIFFLLQIPFLAAEMILLPKFSKNRFLRAVFWCIEVYFLFGVMTYFWRPFVRYNVFKNTHPFYTVISWDKIDVNSMLPTLFENWLRSDYLFGV